MDRSSSIWLRGVTIAGALCAASCVHMPPELARELERAEHDARDNYRARGDGSMPTVTWSASNAP
ncbi:MAG TPA: hypothetical protein P5528_09615 [Steroidobacteraceae bacterium]|nr:hypothetical protein [Steroidobacteraceae bacterium]HRX89690.1 hypothetical protein [Steroidobacteraceae bacterium]